MSTQNFSREGGRVSRSPRVPLEHSARSAAHESLWTTLRGQRLSGIAFRRNHVFGGVTVDFFAPQYHLVVSVNESGVSSKHWYYAKQDAQLWHLGFRALRFTSEEVLRDMPFVQDSIVEVVSRIARRQRRI